MVAIPPHIPNPFLSDVVTDPESPGPVDVQRIHGKPYETCCGGLQRVAAERRSWSILFRGEAGCGKTHLLARFRSGIHAVPGGEDGPLKAMFVAVRMETASSQVWRHLRRRLAERLLQRLPDGSFTLDALLERFAARQGGGDIERAFEAATIPDLTLELMRVLSGYHQGRNRMLAKAWLRGEALADRDLDELGVARFQTEDIEEEQGEYSARQFVLAMTRLMAPLPVVYCFDQLEALELGASGDRGYAPFAKMCASLVDDTTNVLLVSSILLSCLPGMERGAMASDFARLSKDTVDLHPLTWEEAADLVTARLDAVPELTPYRNGGVTPLDEERLKALFAGSPGRATARRLIHHARALFDRAKGHTPPPPPAVADFLGAKWSRLWEESPVRREPGESETALAHGVPIAASVSRIPIWEACRPGVDLCLGEKEAPNLVALVNESNMNSLSARLRKLARALDDAEKNRLILVRDPRLAIRSTARKTREHLQGLQAAGARFVQPPVDATAAVDAIRRLLSMAQSGDLANDGETVGPQTVREWLTANLPEPVGRLMEEFTGGERSTPVEQEALIALLSEKLVLTAAEAAAHCGLTEERIESHARANPDQIGYLAGAPAVVFHVASASDGGADDQA